MGRAEIRRSQKAQKGKPKYGYTAVKYFAYMGVSGLVGLFMALIGTLLNPPLSTLLMLVGVLVAFIGLYIAASYVLFYSTILSEKPNERLWKKIIEFSKIKGNEKYWM